MKVDDATLLAMAKAHDLEEAAQKGEPSPWREDFDRDPEWEAERVAAMRAAVEAMPASALALPDSAPGQWSTPEGREMAERYADDDRSRLCMADFPDLALANALYLATGEIGIQTAAKERMRWLSVQRFLLSADAARYRFLRRQPLDAIHAGGVFAGQTPENLALNGEELDEMIDAAIEKELANG